MLVIISEKRRGGVLQKYNYRNPLQFNQIDFVCFRKGDVKFYLDPYRNVVKINKIRSLRSSLQEGKMVRITTELEKCSGGKSDLVIIGGELRGKLNVEQCLSCLHQTKIIIISVNVLLYL